MRKNGMEQQKLNMQDAYIPSIGRNVIDPLGDGISSVELIRHSGSDLDVVNAARVSYGKVSTDITERDKALIRYLMDHDHSSPFEHNQLSFRIKTPMYVARQWMRHRMNSYNEISYRYVKSPLEFYVPKSWRKQDTVNKQSSYGQFTDEAMFAAYMNSLETAKNAYLALLDQGVCREQARGVLPTCVYTEFIFTCNMHSLLHFIRLRISPHAQYEIRVYAQAMLDLAVEHFPVTVEAFKKKHSL